MDRKQAATITFLIILVLFLAARWRLANVSGKFVLYDIFK